MRTIRALTIGAATLVSIFPLAWLALMTYGGFANVEFYGWIHGYTAGYLLSSIACWSAFAASVTFCALAWKYSARVAIQTSGVRAALVAGVIGDLTISWLTWDNPKLWFPPTFFMWPAAAFIGAGLVRSMLPNPALNTDAERTQRAG